MANEITMTSNLAVSKNGTAITSTTTSKVQTMQSTLGEMSHQTQNVGTSAEDVDVGDVDVTKEYVARFRNQDATNYVDVYIQNSTPVSIQVGRMRPGEVFGPVRAPAQSGGYPKYRLQANTAACLVECSLADAGDPAL